MSYFYSIDGASGSSDGRGDAASMHARQPLPIQFLGGYAGGDGGLVNQQRSSGGEGGAGGSQLRQQLVSSPPSAHLREQQLSPPSTQQQQQLSLEQQQLHLRTGANDFISLLMSSHASKFFMFVNLSYF